jgi:hypothetical protein
MIPWHKLPKDLQRAILAMMLLSGEAAAASSCAPMVCDPPPPPSVQPQPTPVMSPIICDPAPPPASATPTPTTTPARPPAKTPMIFDPPPEPPPASVTPTPTTTPTATPTPARPPAKTPMIFDPPPEPPPAPDSSRLERPKLARGASAALPLAEIRTVSIYWDDAAGDSAAGLVFEAGSPWAGARYRWSASGGTLEGDGERVAWQPPAEAGRYLLQVVADWDAAGLAVDALVLVVGADGSVTVA